MKNLLVMFSIALVFVIGACKESTVLPYDGEELVKEKAKLLTDQYWIIVSTSDPETYSPGITKFGTDGKAVERQFAPELKNDIKWAFSALADSITITYKNQTQKYKIDTLTNSSFAISYSKEGTHARVEYYRVDKDYKYAIAGKIDNRSNRLLDKNMRVECAWFGGAPLGQAIRIYGLGNINPDENRFFIGFETVMPDTNCLLNINESFANFKLALGYVLLFEKEFPEGYYSNLLDKTTLAKTDFVGIIENRNIIMRYGTSGTILFYGKEAPWVNSFANGWSMGEAVQSSDPAVKDYWKNSYPYDLILKIDHINSLNFPVWL